MHNYPSASLLGQVLVSVLSIHVLLAEVAVLVLETLIIHGNQFTENLALDLLHEIIDGIAVDEVALLGVVGMQVEVEGKPVLLVEVGCQLLDGVYGRTT